MNTQLHETSSTATITRWRTTLSLTLRGTTRPVPESSLRQLLAEDADTLEMAISRFRDDSELSRVNRAPGRWHSISSSFAQVLTAALAAAAQTDGLVDPTLGLRVDHAGYRAWRNGTADSQPSVAGSDAPEAQAYWADVSVASGLSGARVRIPTGCQLDLGALGKAWLADHVADRAAATWGTDVLANMGGDLRTHSGDEPWLIGSDPDIPGFDPAALLVPDTALATSGQGKRRWSTPAGPAHHIIDPRTGQSAHSQWWTVSVLADSAVQANTAATAALILDQDGPQWLSDRGLDAWLVAWDGSRASPPSASVTGRWPRECQVAS